MGCERLGKLQRIEVASSSSRVIWYSSWVGVRVRRIERADLIVRGRADLVGAQDEVFL